jgi:LacI family transcriptional regulator
MYEPNFPASRPKPQRAPTITDVARILRISRSTISRAFSRPELLSEETVRKVKQAAESIGYQPNRTARALSTGRHFNLAFVVSDVGNPFVPPILRAAQSEADRTGYSLFLGNADESPEREWTLIDKLRLQTDGLLIVAPRLSDDKIRQIAALKPVVLVNRDTPGIARVIIDSTVGIEAGVQYLATLGHKKLVYLCGPTASWADSQRRIAVRRACTRLKLEIDQIPTAHPDFASGRAAAQAVHATGATAAIAFDDFVAHGLMAGLAQLGIQIPRDFSVIGCDDVLGDATHPTLTSVSSRGAEAGRLAVNLLINRLYSGSDADARRTLETRLVIRASTGPAPRKSGQHTAAKAEPKPTTRAKRKS